MGQSNVRQLIQAEAGSVRVADLQGVHLTIGINTGGQIAKENKRIVLGTDFVSSGDPDKDRTAAWCELRKAGKSGRKYTIDCADGRPLEECAAVAFKLVDDLVRKEGNGIADVAASVRKTGRNRSHIRLLLITTEFKVGPAGVIGPEKGLDEAALAAEEKAICEHVESLLTKPA